MTTQHDLPLALSIPQAAALIGKSRVAIWQQAKATGRVYGVPVIRLNDRVMKVPRLPLERALGIAPEPTPAEIPADWWDR